VKIVARKKLEDNEEG